MECLKKTAMSEAVKRRIFEILTNTKLERLAMGQSVPDPNFSFDGEPYRSLPSFNYHFCFLTLFLKSQSFHRNKLWIDLPALCRKSPHPFFERFVAAQELLEPFVLLLYSPAALS